MKIKLIIRMLEAGLQPIFSDLDAVWLKSPFNFLRQYAEANVLVSTDSCTPYSTAPDSCQLLLADTEKFMEGLGLMNVSFSSLVL